MENLERISEKVLGNNERLCTLNSGIVTCNVEIRGNLSITDRIHRDRRKILYGHLV